MAAGAVCDVLGSPEVVLRLLWLGLVVAACSSGSPLAPHEGLALVWPPKGTWGQAAPSTPTLLRPVPAPTLKRSSRTGPYAAAQPAAPVAPSHFL